MASDAAYDFLRDQNRPFSANDVSQNVGKEHSKSEVQKALDKLVAKKKIFDKTYGKQKVYCVTQDFDLSRMNNTLQELDQQIHEITSSLNTVQEELGKSNSELKSLQTTKTTTEARCERDALLEEISTLEGRLNMFKENAKPISKEEKAKITKEHEKYLKEYRKRKRICTDIVDAILENYPKTKKHLYDDIGIEIDEDVGFKLS